MYPVINVKSYVQMNPNYILRDLCLGLLYERGPYGVANYSRVPVMQRFCVFLISNCREMSIYFLSFPCLTWISIKYINFSTAGESKSIKLSSITKQTKNTTSIPGCARQF